MPVLEDVDILPLPLDQQLFPGVGLVVLVHSGFSIAQAESVPHSIERSVGLGADSILGRLNLS